jgi:predicted metal-dependent hydrolase
MPLTVGDDRVPVRLRRHPRARRLTLRIDAEEPAVALILPQRSSVASALRFLEANTQWVAARLAALPPRIAFADGVAVPVLGVPHVIRHRPESRGRGAVWIAAGEIGVAGEAAHLARRVRDHLRDLARRELAQRTRALAAGIGREIGRVSVRDTRTRWGSCSADGNIAFCWRLILAPEAALHYVVAHEVAHLVHLNHGRRFWRLVAAMAPEWRAQRQWLARNRVRLLRIG